LLERLRKVSPGPSVSQLQNIHGTLGYQELVMWQTGRAIGSGRAVLQQHHGKPLYLLQVQHGNSCSQCNSLSKYKTTILSFSKLCLEHCTELPGCKHYPPLLLFPANRQKCANLIDHVYAIPPVSEWSFSLMSLK